MRNTFTRLGLNYTLIAVIVVFTVAYSAGAQSRPAMRITFESDEIKVTGTTSGAEVVAFGIGIGRYNHMPLLTRDAISEIDEDRDGVVVFRPSLFVSRAVWVAVDV